MSADPLGHIRDCVRQVREHDHPSRDDLFCLNLVAYLGGKMGAVLAEYDRLKAEAASLRSLAEDVLTLAQHCKTYAEGDVHLAATRVLHRWPATAAEEPS